MKLRSGFDIVVILFLSSPHRILISFAVSMGPPSLLVERTNESIFLLWEGNRPLFHIFLTCFVVAAAYAQPHVDGLVLRRGVQSLLPTTTPELSLPQGFHLPAAHLFFRFPLDVVHVVG